MKRERAGERIEMPPIGRRHTREAERLSERDDRGIDEAKLQVIEASIEIRDARVPVPRKIDDEVCPGGDSGVEGLPALRTKPHAE